MICAPGSSTKNHGGCATACASITHHGPVEIQPRRRRVSIMPERTLTNHPVCCTSRQCRAWRGPSQDHSIPGFFLRAGRVSILRNDQPNDEALGVPDANDFSAELFFDSELAKLCPARLQALLARSRPIPAFRNDLFIRCRVGRCRSTTLHIWRRSLQTMHDKSKTGYGRP